MNKKLKTWQDFVDLQKEEVGMKMASEDNGLNNMGVGVYSVTTEGLEVDLYKVTDQ